MTALTDTQPELHSLVLAAGGSERLGVPKQLLEIQQETLLHRVCRQTLQVCSHVTVVLGADAASMNQAVADLPLARVINPDWQTGMASSIRTGVTALPITADAVLIVLCDQVYVNEADLQRLIDAWQAQPHRIVAAAYSGLKGVPVIMPREHFADLLALKGDRGARDILKINDDAVTGITVPNAAADIDTSADIADLHELTSSCTGRSNHDQVNR